MRSALLAVSCLSAALVGGITASASTDTTEGSSDTTADTTAASDTAATTGTDATSEATQASSGATEASSEGTGGGGTAPAVECPEEEQGLSDTEVVLGGTYPLSGPVAAYASIPKGIDAWFQHLNDTEGGVTFGDGVTRKLTWNYLDDQYTPNRSLENVRNLMENEGSWFVFNPLGTPPNLAIRDYMNENEFPQLYVATGAATWGNDHEEYPWTIGYQPDYQTEGIAYAAYILGENPDAKIGVLYQNDDFGKDYLEGLKKGLGDNADQLVSEVTYEVTDASIDSQVSQVVDSDVDAFVLIATPQFAIQGLQRLQAVGFDGIKVLTSVSSSVAGVIEPAGAEAATDFVSSVYLKDPSNPEFDEDPAMMEYKDVLAEYYPDANPDDGFYVFGMSVAQLLQHTFESMTTVCRASLMAAAENLNWDEAPLLRDGIGVHTGEGDYFPIQQVVLEKWDGEKWVTFGDIIDAADQATDEGG